MKKIVTNLLFTTVLMTINNLSYALGDDNINYLDIFSEYNREITLHPESLFISNLEFKEENCQRYIEFNGDHRAESFRCKFCNKKTKNCLPETAVSLSFCEIPAGLSTDHQLYIGSCSSPTDVYDNLRNCGYTSPIDIQASSCDQSQLLEISKKNEIRHQMNNYAIQATRDILSYLDLGGNCSSYENIFHLDRMKDFIESLGPFYLNSSLNYLPFVPNDSDEISLFKELSTDSIDQSLQLTGGEELITPNQSRASDWIPWWMKSIGRGTSYVVSEASSQLYEMGRIYSAATVTMNTGMLPDESFKFVDDMAYGAVYTLDSISKRVGLDKVPALLDATDRAIGSSIAVLQQGHQIYSGVHSRLTESDELLQKSDPSVQKKVLIDLDPYIQKLETVNSGARKIQSVLTAINSSPEFWQTMDEISDKVKEAHKKVLDLKEAFTTKALEDIDDPEVKRLRGEVKLAQENLLKWQGAVHEQIETTLRSIEKTNPGVAQYREMYLAIHTKYVEPMRQTLSGEAASFKKYSDSWHDDFIKVLGMESLPDKYSDPLALAVQQYDDAWKKAAAGDIEAKADFELARKNVSNALQEIIEDAPKIGLDSKQLDQIVRSVEASGAVPVRYSVQIQQALTKTNEALGTVLNRFNQDVKTVSAALERLNRGELAATDFLNQHKSQLLEIRQNLLEPDFQKVLSQNGEEIVEKVKILSSHLHVLPDLPDSVDGKARAYEVLKARVQLEALGLIESPWEEGWAKRLNAIGSSLPRVGHTGHYGGITVEETVRLKDLLSESSLMEQNYYLLVRQGSQVDSDALYQARKSLIESRQEINRISEKISPKSRAKAVLGGLTQFDFQKSPVLLTTNQKINKLLERAVRSTKIEEADHLLKGLSNLFDKAGNVTEFGAKMFHQSLTPSTMSDWQKAALKFVGVSFPPEMHETVVAQIKSQQSQVQSLFSSYPPKTVAEGTEFARKFNELILPDWKTLSGGQKESWDSFAKKISSKFSLSIVPGKGKKLYEFTGKQVLSYFEWKGFSNEVIAQAQARGFAITDADVWDHFAKIDKSRLSRLSPTRSILWMGSKAGTGVAQSISSHYLNILPPDLQRLATERMEENLKYMIDDNMKYKQKTVSGNAIDLRNTDSFVDDLLSVKFGRMLLAEDGSLQDKTTLDFLRFQYIKKFLLEGNFETAGLLISKYFYSNAIKNIDSSRLQCEPLKLLSERIIKYREHQLKILETEK